MYIVKLIIVVTDDPVFFLVFFAYYPNQPMEIHEFTFSLKFEAALIINQVIIPILHLAHK